VPRETQAIHARVIAELKAKNVARNALPEGASAPPFELKNQDGKLVRSADLLAKGRLVVCFFRGRCARSASRNWRP